MISRIIVFLIDTKKLNDPCRYQCQKKLFCSRHVVWTICLIACSQVLHHSDTNSCVRTCFKMSLYKYIVLIYLCHLLDAHCTDWPAASFVSLIIPMLPTFSLSPLFGHQDMYKSLEAFIFLGLHSLLTTQWYQGKDLLDKYKTFIHVKT